VFVGGGNGPLLPGWLWSIVKTLAVLALLVHVRRKLPTVRMERFTEVGWLVRHRDLPGPRGRHDRHGRGSQGMSGLLWALIALPLGGGALLAAASCAHTASSAAHTTSPCSRTITCRTTSSIVILSAPAVAGASLLVVAVESPTIMDAAVAGTVFSAIPSEPLLHQPYGRDRRLRRFAPTARTPWSPTWSTSWPLNLSGAPAPTSQFPTPKG
jgi:hypothetical protein